MSYPIGTRLVRKGEGHDGKVVVVTDTHVDSFGEPSLCLKVEETGEDLGRGWYVKYYEPAVPIGAFPIGTLVRRTKGPAADHRGKIVRVKGYNGTPGYMQIEDPETDEEIGEGGWAPRFYERVGTKHDFTLAVGADEVLGKDAYRLLTQLTKDAYRHGYNDALREVKAGLPEMIQS